MLSKYLEHVLPDNPKPWGAFFKKAILSTALVGGISYVAIDAFSERFVFYYDGQPLTCLPGQRFFLVDKFDRTPVKGLPFAFHAKGVGEHIPDDPRLDSSREAFADGKRILKMVDGAPGDVINVTVNGVLVNDQPINIGELALAKTLGKKPEAFVRSFTLGEGEFFFGGRTFNSFDSRYWGSVNETQIIGRAYNIF